MNLDTVFAIIVAAIVATVLRWGASRWPGGDDAARKRASRLAQLEEEAAIRRLEKELREDEG